MAEKEKKGGRFSADEKLAIIEEARAPNTTVAEVLRRHQLDATTFYQWEKRAKAAMLEVLGKSAEVSRAVEAVRVQPTEPTELTELTERRISGSPG